MATLARLDAFEVAAAIHQFHRAALEASRGVGGTGEYGPAL